MEMLRVSDRRAQPDNFVVSRALQRAPSPIQA